MSCNRQKNVKYDDDWEDDLEQEEDIDEYEEDFDIEDIEEEISYELDREEIRKILRKNNGNIDNAIDYIEDFKEKILKDIEKKIKNQTDKKIIVNQNHQKKNNPINLVEKDIEQYVNQKLGKKNSRRISQEVLDLLDSENKLVDNDEKFKIQRNLLQYNTEYKNQEENGEAWGIYQEKVKKEKKGETINLVVAGHVDSGKSTLIGNLLYEMKVVEEKAMRKFEKESKIMNKESFMYAWVTDSSALEREKGVTIEVGYRQFIMEVPQSEVVVNIMDTPGHKDFVPNMINGAAQADIAILVLDSVHNAFEAGFLNGGQTREHLLLLKALGINRIIFAVNKQDQTNWSEDRFNTIKTQVDSYLDTIGKFEEVNYVPLSGRLGQNVLNRQIGQNWYKGPTLVESLQNSASRLLSSSKGDLHLKPTRVTISNLYSNSLGYQKLRGHCASGKVESGVFNSKTNYVIMPQGVVCQVKEILVNELAGNAVNSSNEKLHQAHVGQMIDCSLIFQKNYEFSYLRIGSVISQLDYIVPIAKRFTCEIFAYDLLYPILKGANITVHTGLNKVKAHVKVLCKIIDRSSGVTVKKNPKCIKSHECCEIEIQCDEMIPIELFSNIACYGRIALRECQNTIAVGMIKEIK